MTVELLTNTASPRHASPLCSLLEDMPASIPGAVETYDVSAPAPFDLRLPGGVGAAQFRVVIDDEYMVVAAKADGSSPWTVTRGAENSPPQQHLAGTSVFLTVTEASITALAQAAAASVSVTKTAVIATGVAAADIGGEPAGAAAAAQAAAIAAASGSAAQRSANLSDIASAPTARTNLGLGSAATQPSSAFDTAGAASAAQTAAIAASDALGTASGVLATSVQKSANLSDVASAPTARTNLGLGSAATQATAAFDAAGVATTAVTTHLAATDPHADRAYADTNKTAKSANLSDLASAPTARGNLGLGTAATQPTSAFDAAGLAAAAQAASDAAGSASAAQAASAQKTANLSDLASAPTARTNLGLGTAATQATGAFDASGVATTAVTAHTAAADPHADRAFATTSVTTHTAAADPHADRAYADTNKVAKASNLSDLASAPTARTNLGLGSAATQASAAFDAAGLATAAQTAAVAASAQRASNLSDLASAPSARTNLGLGTAAVAALDTASGAAKVGSDGYVGGTAGTALTPGVGSVRLSSGQRLLKSTDGTTVPEFPAKRDDLTLMLDDYWNNPLYSNSPAAGMAAAISTLSALGGGTLVASAKSYTGLDGDVLFPAYVNFVGKGKRYATKFSSPTGNWTIAFQSRGGLSGHFSVVGTAIAYGGTPASGNIGSVQRTFVDLECISSWGDAHTVDGSQNCTFIGCDSTAPVGSNWVLRNGASANQMLRCEIESPSVAGIRSYQQAGGPYNAASPLSNVFDGCIIERAATSAVAAIWVQGGLLEFRGVAGQIACTRAGFELPNIFIGKFDGISTTAQVWLNKARLFGGSSATAIKTDTSFTVRTDAAATGSSGSTTITDAAVVAGDLGILCTGTNIPAGSYVGTVTAGASFVLVDASGTPVNPAGAVSGIKIGGTPAGGGGPGPSVYLTGPNYFNSFNIVYRLADATFVIPTTGQVYNSCTTIFSNNGGVKSFDQLVHGNMTEELDFTRPVAGQITRTVKLTTDGGYRFVETGDGKLYVGDGSTFSYATNYPYITAGTGSPNGVITARPGSLYLRMDGSTNAAMYRKETGTGNVGWVASVTPTTSANGQPQDAPAGALAVTFDRSQGSTSVSLTSGTLWVSRMKYLVPAGQTITNINFRTVSLFTPGTTAPHAAAYLLDDSRTVQGVSADVGTTGVAANTTWTFSLAAGSGGSGIVTPGVDTAYTVGIICIVGTGGTPVTPALVMSTAERNEGNSILPVITGTAYTGQTTLPAVTAGTTILPSYGGVSNQPLGWLT